MKDLITETRELCQKHNPCENCEYAYDDICRDRFCVSREKDRLITELCAALEKAENRIKLLEEAIERQNNTITYLNSTNGQGFNW